MLHNLPEAPCRSNVQLLLCPFIRSQGLPSRNSAQESLEPTYYSSNDILDSSSLDWDSADYTEVLSHEIA